MKRPNAPQIHPPAEAWTHRSIPTLVVTDCGPGFASTEMTAAIGLLVGPAPKVPS